MSVRGRLRSRPSARANGSALPRRQRKYSRTRAGSSSRMRPSICLTQSALGALGSSGSSPRPARAKPTPGRAHSPSSSPASKLP